MHIRHRDPPEHIVEFATGRQAGIREPFDPWGFSFSVPSKPARTVSLPTSSIAVAVLAFHGKIRPRLAA